MKLANLLLIILVVIICGSLASCKKKKSSTPEEPAAPAVVVPTAPSTLNATRDTDAPWSTINLTWNDNSSDETGFSIARSTDDVTFTEIGTASANATTYSDTTASASTTYYYRVRAQGSSGNSAYTTSAMIATEVQYKLVFISNSTPAANMIGPTNADGICNADANRPNNSFTYKALLGATNGVATSRTACTTAFCSGGPSEHVRWVLQANMQYRRDDRTTIIATTNANAIFPFPLINSFGTCTSGVAWSGFHVDWTSTANSCGGWTWGGSSDASLMDCDTVASTALKKDANGAFTCNTTHQLVCVQQ